MKCHTVTSWISPRAGFEPRTWSEVRVLTTRPPGRFYHSQEAQPSCTWVTTKLIIDKNDLQSTVSKLCRSREANWSGSTLFAKTGHAVFSKRRVNIKHFKLYSVCEWYISFYSLIKFTKINWALSRVRSSCNFTSNQFFSVHDRPLARPWV